MKYVTPEQAGVKSENVLKFIERLEHKCLSSHSVIMAKGDCVFFEKYWHPFNKDFKHRLYSASKSFVSIAIGFLEQDGLINLDDRIDKYFADDMKNQTDENMRSQTIRDMLMMRTGKAIRNWFPAKPDDRVRFYFENDNPQSRPPGTVFNYDSGASFVLGVLVERLTGLLLLDYLRVKLFDKIGVSEDISCLKCPGGHSWGDSAILCKPIDFCKVALFVMRKGKWNGEQILNEKYLTEATSPLSFNNIWGMNHYETYGYGYQFWRTYANGFLFNGMGDQLGFCFPDQDIILIYNADNQGKDLKLSDTVAESFVNYIVNTASVMQLPDNPIAQKTLSDRTQSLKLQAVSGISKNDFEASINGLTYELDENPMGIKEFRLNFDDGGGRFEYINAQGKKSIPFGRCENVFSKFPQEGYCDEVATVSTKNHYYKCCASGAWVESEKFFIKVQIIDNYFGSLGITFGFKDDQCGLFMNKVAEDFLGEYEGFAGGKVKHQAENKKY
ncbi:MAG: serine hydrolase [Clostridia bacterium]|nr:serine hydrolase [Clostridia bacterium]